MSSNTKKRILIYIQMLTNGGAERNAVLLANALKEHGHEVLLVTRTKAPEVYIPKTKIYRMDFKRSKNVFGKALLLFKAIRKLRKVKKEFNPDYSISYLPAENIVNVLTKHKSKTIVAVRSFFSARSHSKFVKKLTINLYNKSDQIIAQTERMKEDLVFNKAKADKISVINNLFDIEMIKTNNNELVEEPYKNILFNQKNIITIGRIVKQKRQLELLKTINALKSMGDNYNLIIIGRDFGYKEPIIDYATKHNLLDNLYFIDYTSNPHKYLKGNSVFFLASDFEGFPNVLVEAMISKIPVISTDCPTGPKEIIGNNEYGILIDMFKETNDVFNEYHLEVGKKVKDLLTNNDLYNNYVEQGTKRSLDFTIDKIVRDWEEVLFNI